MSKQTKQPASSAAILVSKLSEKADSVDDAHLVRQNQLKERLQTSTAQYEYLTKRYSEKKLEKIRKSLDAYKYGLNAAAPLICMGPERCPFFQACPIGEGVKIESLGDGPIKRIPIYDDIEDFPVGDQCIAEKVFIEQRLLDYVDEFDVDPNRPSELALINDLALVDLHKQRAVLFMASGDREGEGFDFQKVDVMYDSDSGAEIGRAYKEHPIMQIIDRLEKRRHKILEELIATRKAKAEMQAKFHSTGETSQLQQEIVRIRELIVRRDKEHKLLAEDARPLLEMVEEEEDYIKLDS
jgi:hypothetical protein